MTDKRKQLRVGLFTIVAAGLAALVVVVFGGIKFWRHHSHYYIEFDHSVMGLVKGAQVYMNGIEVGRVDDFAIDRGDLSRVRVDVALDPDTPVRADTVATLDLAGITGLKVIDLKGGSLTAATLPPGGTILAGEGTLEKLEKRAEQLADQTGKLMQRADEIATAASRVMTTLGDAIDPETLRAIPDGARRGTADLAEASRGIAAMVVENRVALRRSLDAVTGAASNASALFDQRIGGLVDNASSLISDVRGVVHGNEATLQATTADLRQASRSFKELARELRDHPSRILFSRTEPDRKLP
jgi:phospholipid/cholesterol/gamma-HCH transport system substrate-binding protein